MAQTPQIGTYTPQISPQESLPRRTVPTASGESIAPGIYSLAGAVERKQKADAAVQAANALSDFRVRQMQSFIAAQQDPGLNQDGSGFTGTVLDAYDKDAASLQKGAGRGYSAPLIQAGLRQFREHLAGKAIEWEANQGVNYRADSIIQNADKVAAVVEQDPSQHKAATAPIMEAISNSGFEPETRLKLARQVDAVTTLAAARGMARDNPQGTLAEINDPGKAGDVIGHLSPPQREAIKGVATQRVVQTTGDGIVNTYRSLGPQAGGMAFASIDKATIPDEQKDAIRQHVHAGLAQAEGEAQQTNAQQIIGLETRIGAGKPASNDRAVAWDLYHKLAFGPQKLAGTLAAIDRANEKNTVDDSNLRFAQGAIFQGRALDPKSPDVKKGVDDAFVSDYGKAPPGSQEWTNGGANIAHQTGVVPDTLVSWSRAQLVGGAPDKAAQAAEALTRVMDASPRGGQYAIDADTLHMAREVVSMTKAGTDPATAVEIARHNATLPESDRKLLEEKYRKLTPDLSAPSVLKRQLGQGREKDVYNPGVFNNVPEAPPAMLGEFNDLVHQYYLKNNGNLLNAQQMAAEDLKNSWGVTNVNGQRELMKFAPERMFPGLTTEAIRKDMEMSVAGLGYEKFDQKRVRLVEAGDGSTASTRGQIWNLTVPGKFGEFETIVGKDHRPLQYEMPVGIADQEAIRQKQVAEDMAHTREVQRILKEHENMDQVVEDAKARDPQVKALLIAK